MKISGTSRFTTAKLLFIFLFGLTSFVSQAQKILRVAIAGLAHDHVHGILQQYKKGEVIIAGIAEADEQLVMRYKKNISCPTPFSSKHWNRCWRIPSPMPFWRTHPFPN